MTLTINTIANHTPLSTPIKWYPSPITEGMQQAMVRLSEDIELCVEVGGNPANPPLLFIMGLGSQLVFWPDPLINALIDAGFYVIRYDNRDIGLSTKIARHKIPRSIVLKNMIKLPLGIAAMPAKLAYELTDMADDAALLIQALGLKQVNVVGASMGGMIAQILAAKRPDLIASLALLFSTNNRPFLRPPHYKQLMTLIKSPPSQDKDAIINHGKWFINTISSPGHIDNEEVSRLAELRFTRSYYPAGMLHQFHAILAAGSLQDYSQAIAAPTLVMHGTEDGLIPIAHSYALAEDIPNASFVPIKGMAHDLPSYFIPFIVSQIKKHML